VDSKSPNEKFIVAEVVRAGVAQTIDIVRVTAEWSSRRRDRITAKRSQFRWRKLVQTGLSCVRELAGVPK
jgi:hypothetical protein